MPSYYCEWKAQNMILYICPEAQRPASKPILQIDNCHVVWNGLLSRLIQFGSKINDIHVFLATLLDSCLSEFCWSLPLRTTLLYCCWKCWGEDKEMIANQYYRNALLLMWGSWAWFFISILLRWWQETLLPPNRYYMNWASMDVQEIKNKKLF